MIVPYLGYADAAKAIGMLTAAFGFEQRARYDGDDGRVMHAELALNDSYVMLGSWPSDQPPATPVEGSGIYVVVDDVDAHHEQARKAGATIVYGPEDTEFGTRRYRAKDTEGYEWSFGTYAPGQGGDGG